MRQERGIFIINAPSLPLFNKEGDVGSLRIRMQIIINGEQKDFKEGLSVIALLAELGVQKERVAVELNLDIVPKGRFGDTILKDGDSVEIVSFVGGG